MGPLFPIRRQFVRGPYRKALSLPDTSLIAPLGTRSMPDKSLTSTEPRSDSVSAGSSGDAPAEVGSSIVAQHVQNSVVHVWQGQFPPPEALERYEAILPGSFERILAMAERLQEAGITEAWGAQYNLRTDVKRGHWLGFGTTMVAILGAVVCVIIGTIGHGEGPFWVAGLLVSVPVMAVAKALVESARSIWPGTDDESQGSEPRLRNPPSPTD